MPARLKYVRKWHYIARYADSLIEEGQNPSDITKIYLTNNLKEFANWVEDMWAERKKHLYK